MPYTRSIYTYSLLLSQIDIYIKLKSVYAKIYHGIMNNKTNSVLRQS